MTVKELANVAGVSTDTIRREISKTFPTAVKKGVKTDLTNDQSKIIMSHVKKRNMVSVPTQNADVPTQNADVMGMFKLMMEQQQTFMVAMLGEIKNISKPQLQLDQPKQDYFSLVAFCNLKGIKVTHSEAIMHGKYLKKLCSEQNKETRTVPDERWGKVNSYPIEVLEEYFTV